MALEHDTQTVREWVGLCQPMLRSLAWQMSRRLPASVGRDDLISEGQVGLLQAVRKFDRSKGVKFSTFAHHRIRGAMFDWCRRQHWFNWHDYHAGTLADQHPSADPYGDATTSENTAPPNRRRVAEDQVVDARAESPAQAVEDDEMRALLQSIVGQLDGPCRHILTSTLLEGQTLQAAGDEIGVTRGWAQRLQTKGLDALASALEERDLSTLSGADIRKRLTEQTSGRGGKRAR